MQQNKNSGMSAREKAIYEHNMRKAKSHSRKKRKALYKKALRILILSFALSLIFALILSLCIYADMGRTPEKYNYAVKIIKDEKSVSLEKGIKIENNTCYAPLGDVADVLGFDIMGDVKVMSLVSDSGEKVSYYTDTNVVKAAGVFRYTENPAFFSVKEAEVYVPVSSLMGLFENVEVSGVKKRNKITYTISITGEPMLSFSENKDVPLVDTSGIFVATAPGTPFKADLSAYEKYMDPEDRDAYVYLINTSNPLPDGYVPEDLTEISFTRNDRAAVKMREYAAKALDAMFIEMQANGFSDVSVTSAYRSFDYQTQLFNNSYSNFKKYYDNDTAYTMTASQIAIPGTSEHQSGLCADLHNLPAASQAFEGQKAFEWLYSRCADFGFILRFPKDKTEITGIIYEPWHYRYVGRYHAKKIMQSGLCLEEYCEKYGYIK